MNSILTLYVNQIALKVGCTKYAIDEEVTGRGWRVASDQSMDRSYEERSLIYK